MTSILVAETHLEPRTPNPRSSVLISRKSGPNHIDWTYFNFSSLPQFLYSNNIQLSIPVEPGSL